MSFIDCLPISACNKLYLCIITRPVEQFIVQADKYYQLIHNVADSKIIILISLINDTIILLMYCMYSLQSSPICND